MQNKKILVTGFSDAVIAGELVAVAEQIRSTLGWTPKYDDLDAIVRTSLEWERKIAAEDPSAYWAA